MKFGHPNITVVEHVRRLDDVNRFWVTKEFPRGLCSSASNAITPGTIPTAGGGRGSAVAIVVKLSAEKIVPQKIASAFEFFDFRIFAGVDRLHKQKAATP